MKVKVFMIITVLLLLILNVYSYGTTNQKVITNNKVFKAGNISNLVLYKILNDNTLKEEIPKMFSYASNGVHHFATEIDPSYITEGLYSSQDENGITYYYRGNIRNNNLQFGSYDEDYYIYGFDGNFFQSLESCQSYLDYYNDDINQCNSIKLASKGAKMYWKIIRINGDGSIRLIYNGPGVNYSNYAISQSVSDGQLSGVVGGTPYNLASSDRKYTGYTYDNGTSSFVKNEVDTWYNNTLGRNSNYDSQVILGRFCSDSSNYNYDSKGSFASGSRLAATSLDLEQYNNPTFICPSTTENIGGSYQLKAGLITADEIVFAGENIYVHGDSYLNIGSTSYWSMTPSFFGYDHINAANWIMTSGNYMYDWGVSSYSYGIRPVINLSVSNMALQGDGTSGNPYILVLLTDSFD